MTDSFVGQQPSPGQLCKLTFIWGNPTPTHRNPPTNPKPIEPKRAQVYSWLLVHRQEATGSLSHIVGCRSSHTYQGAVRRVPSRRSTTEKSTIGRSSVLDMNPMKRISILQAIAMCAVALIAFAASRSDDEAAPLFGIKLPPGYRDWKLISVAHEEGNLNDLRAVLGNDVAIKAYREGKLPFPDGTIIARLAWSYVPSEENDKVFGRSQSFVAGSATNVQFMVKDSKKYACNGRLGVRSI